MSLNVIFSATRTPSEILATILNSPHPYQRYGFYAAIGCAAFWTLLRCLRISCRQWHKVRTTWLRGPPSESFLYGVGRYVLDTEDAGAVHEAWAQEYGPVYAVPWTLWTEKIILCDSKAIAHFFAKETWTYTRPPINRQVLTMLFGKGISWANGETHKRQRKYLARIFSIPAIRRLTSVFYDSAYKVKGAWVALIESSDGDGNGAIIDVQDWMGRMSLDIIGIAGFSHNFGTLDGKHANVIEVLDTFSTSLTAFDQGIILLGLVLPFLVWLPTPRMKIFQDLNMAMEEILNVLLTRTQMGIGTGVGGDKDERSIVGSLIKRANEDMEFHLTKGEVISQMKQTLLGGYETISASLTWALLELSRNPDMQSKLRDELIGYDADPTYDQLVNGLPYLDAVVHETLRLHPPVTHFTSMAVEDDVVPLSEPIRARSGTLIDSLTIAKGTFITVSIGSMNRSAAFWGEDAKMFRPSRWLQDAQGQDGIPGKAKEIQGHRHLLTFVDGPRTCLGKHFALAELKAALAVLVKNFVFELRDGVHTKIEIGKGVLSRPKITGEGGTKVPLRVRSYSG